MRTSLIGMAQSCQTRAALHLSASLHPCRWYDCLVGAVEQGSARVDDPLSWPEHIQRRYGFQARRRRGLLVIVIVTAIFIAPLLAQFAWRSGTEQGVLSMPSHEVVSDSTVNLRLSYAGRNREFVCAVRAQDYDRQDVGYAYLQFPPGPARTWEYPLRTRERAVLAAVVACRPGLDASGLPAPQFPPGVKPPLQAPPGLTPRVEGGFATVRS